MRLKHSMAPLGAVESRRNLCNSGLQDCNSNETNFNDSALWEPIRRSQPSATIANLEEEYQYTKLQNFGRPCQPSAPLEANQTRLPARPRGQHLRGCSNTRHGGSGQRDLPDDNRRLPGDATAPSSSSSSSSSSSRSASTAASPAPLEYGIVNPNYPGFEHLAAKLLKLAAGSDGEDGDDEENNNNENNNKIAKLNNINNREDEDLVNQDRLGCSKQALYDKPKLAAAMADAVLSSAKEDLSISKDFLPAKLAAKHAKMGDMLHAVHSPPAARHCKQDSNRVVEEMDLDEEEKFSKESTEKDCVVPRKKEKMAMNLRKARGLPLSLSDRTERRLSMAGHAAHHAAHHAHKKRSSLEILGGFDVYNIETAMPRIDLDLIESHLRAAKEEERRRRNDREEIRRRLAMGTEDADYYSNDQKPGKKPSLQARLQSGMNLQICFMNETLSDTESPGSEGEVSASGTSVNPATLKAVAPKSEIPSERLPGGSIASKPTRPLSLPLRLDSDHEWREHSSLMTEADFLARQAQLQTEARMALAQAKDMAHMQMEIERQRQNASPITEMVRHTLQKVGVSFPEDRRRLSRQILTEMNVAQLQVIVNDLHTQIEYLNESLVRFLMERDDLHMEQDSMLVDIEDLTRYLGAKEQSSKSGATQNNNLFKTNTSTGLEKVGYKK